MKLLNGLSRSEFLKQHWQKKALYIEQAINDFIAPIDKHDLFALACHEDVESRLISHDGKNNHWQCEYGPFDLAYLQQLPEKDWTLLVQSVDHHHPEIADLLELFDFIPKWRVDDIMISYAVDGGNVGPHLDNYDVFLLQASGQRHWHINASDYTDSDYIEGLEVKILKEFNAEHDWILKPGDMLYLPPGVAHHGIAQGECLTFSIGFRAPDERELLTAFADDLVSIEKPLFYSDPDLELQNHTGEIKQEHIRYIHQMMSSRLTHDESFERWFGRYITESIETDEDLPEIDFEYFHTLYKQKDVLFRKGHIRLSYLLRNHSIDLFIAGNHELFPIEQLEFIQLISNKRKLIYTDILRLSVADEILLLLYRFYQQGYYFFDE